MPEPRKQSIRTSLKLQPHNRAIKGSELLLIYWHFNYESSMAWPKLELTCSFVLASEVSATDHIDLLLIYQIER